MPARSKTLGPGFMRGLKSDKLHLGYMNSMDNGNGDPQFKTISLKSRFSANQDTNYDGET